LSFDSYSGLLAAIANWTERHDLTDHIPDFIRLAEAQINCVLRVHQMEARETVSVSAEYLALPATYLDGLTIRLSDGASVWSLDPAPRELLDSAGVQPGRPRAFSIVGNDIQFYPAPDQTYTARLTHYGTIPPLTEANPSNWLLEGRPDAYLYGTLLQAAVYLVDSGLAATASDGFNNALAGVRRMQRSMAGKLTTDLVSLTGRGGYDITRDR